MRSRGDETTRSVDMTRNAAFAQAHWARDSEHGEVYKSATSAARPPPRSFTNFVSVSSAVGLSFTSMDAFVPFRISHHDPTASYVSL